MQYIAGHLDIPQKDWRDNNLLPHLTSKLLQLSSAPRPVASCVLGVQNVTFTDPEEEKLLAPDFHVICEKQESLIKFLVGLKTEKDCLSIQFWCHMDFLSSLIVNFVWERNKRQENYIYRKTALEIYIQSAKCQAGLSVLKQSFFVLSCTMGANPFVKLESKPLPLKWKTPFKCLE